MQLSKTFRFYKGRVLAILFSHFLWSNW